ncbi:MAG: hypothetical protein PHO37_07705 [Kiritimatiellae bacterium]|nr:hypothetical protein [Kiritimatiellia bacterium]
MKYKCPECGKKIEISDQEILQYIERSQTMRGEVASLLGKLTGGKTKLDAEGRRQRALKAAQAREAKRNASKSED